MSSSTLQKSIVHLRRSLNCQRALSTFSRRNPTAIGQLQPQRQGQHNLIQTKFHLTNCTFSTKVNVENDNDDNNPPVTINIETETETETERKPSPLVSLPNDFTPGQAWNIFQTNYSGGKFIRNADFTQLCDASRPTWPRDAKVIRTALLDLKRCNQFKPNTIHAEAAVRGMVRSFLHENGLDESMPKYRLRAGVWVGQVLVDENSGLYVSAETSVINEHVLKTLLSGVENIGSDADMVSNDVDADADADANSAEEDDSVDEFTVQSAATVTKSIVDMLLLRASSPTRNMKKRAKRKYLRYSKCSSGPTPETIDYAVKICLKDEENGLTMARHFLDEYDQRPFLGIAMSETVALVEAKEEELKNAADAAAIASASDATDEEKEEN